MAPSSPRAASAMARSLGRFACRLPDMRCGCRAARGSRAAEAAQKPFASKASTSGRTVAQAAAQSTTNAEFSGASAAASASNNKVKFASEVVVVSGDVRIRVPLVSECTGRAVTADEEDIVAERQQLRLDGAGQSRVIAVGEVRAADGAAKQNVADQCKALCPIEQHDRPRRVTGTVEHDEAVAGD